MINNRPYNVPQKQPLSQSQILSENSNLSRHSLQYNLPIGPTSPYQMNQRHQKPAQVYSSAIFLKNEGITTSAQNGVLHQLPKYRASIDQNQKFHSPNVDHNNHHLNNFNSPNFFKPPKSNQHTYMSPKISIENNSNHKMQSQRPSSKYREHTSSTSSLNGNTSANLIINNSQSNFDQEINQIKSSINEIRERLSQNQKQTEKISMSQSQFLRERTALSQSLKKLESQRKIQDKNSHCVKLEHKLKNIQKTIRSMGEDIHLINDKQDNFSVQVHSELQKINLKYQELQKERKNLQNNDISIKIVQISSEMTLLRNEMQTLLSSVNNYEKNSQRSQTMTVEQLTALQLNYQKLDAEIKIIKDNQKTNKLTSQPALHFKYLEQPIILKYIQSFQVKMPPKLRNTSEDNVITIQLSQLTYYIDKQGNILDNQRYYLLNGNNQKIRLNQSHLKELRANNVLI